jgi:hypothetical protein
MNKPTFKGIDVYIELDNGNTQVRKAVMLWITDLIRDAPQCSAIECPFCGKEFEV